MSKGFLLVVDGINGAGKTTQVNLLSGYLKSKNIAHEVISFPRYGQNLYADLVKRYLAGEFGEITDVNPYLISLAYAGDRALAKDQIRKWLGEGKLVIANRYASSSKAHMGSNISSEKREEFKSWLDDLEYKTNGLPKEDLTILLKVDVEVAQRNAQTSFKSNIHEQDLEHLEEANKIYLQLSKSEENWVVVNCMENDEMKSKEEISQEIIKIVSDKLPS